MTRTYCDICGEEIVQGTEHLPYYNSDSDVVDIMESGVKWDMCPKCKGSLIVWIKKMRKEKDDG